MGERGEAKVDVLFDSGSTHCAIRADLARKLDTPRRFPLAVPILLATEGPTVSVKEWVALNLWLDGRELRGLFAVVDKLRAAVVVGADYADDWDIHLHLRGGRISIGVTGNGSRG